MEIHSKKLEEITCPWPWIDFDGETLERAYRKKVTKFNGETQTITDPDGTVIIRIICQHLDGPCRKYVRACIREKVLPNETAQDLLDC
jgi:hypothetical protein